MMPTIHTECNGWNERIVLKLYLMFLYMLIIISNTTVMGNIKWLVLLTKVMIIVSDAHTESLSTLQVEKRSVVCKSPFSSWIRLFCCGTPFLFKVVVLTILFFASLHRLVHFMAGKMIRRAPHNMMKKPAT